LKSSSLSALLFRMLWLCVTPLLMLAIWLAWDTLREQDARMQDEGRNVARSYAASIDSYLRARIGGLSMLAASRLNDDPRQLEALYEEALAFLKSYDTHVVLADSNLQMRFNTRTPFGTKLPRLPTSRGKSAAPAALATGRPQVGDIVQGPVVNQPLVAIAVPGIRQGVATHVLLSTVTTEQLRKRLDSVGMPDDWSISLLDGAGQVIARRAPENFDSRKVAADHRHVQHLELSPWSVVLEIPPVSQGLYQRQSIWVLAGAIVLALSLGVITGTRTARRISGQMALLTAPGSVPSAGSDISEIARARFLLDRTRAEESASSERFARLFSLAPVPMTLAENDGRLLTLNTRFQQLFGYKLADVPDMVRWFEQGYPDTSQRQLARDDWNAIHSLSAGQGFAQTERQTRIRCKDGRQVDVLLSRILLPDGVLTAFVDITGLKATESALSDALERQKAMRVALLNQMEDANAARKEVLAANANLERHVAERTAELSAANRELDAFAYAVTHDLRAPLRAMIGFSQALQEDHADQLQGEARIFLEQINIASQRMSDLVDGLLAVSRSTRGEIERSWTDLSLLATRHAAELSTVDPHRKVEFDIEPGLMAHGDARMLDAVLANLLDNAWKYTSRTEGAVIRFFRGEIEGRPAFSVSDNGAGFDMRHAERLFKPFQRMHRQDEFPGIGIGLATVKRIIDRHGGRITATAAPGRGATFLFTLEGSTTPEKPS
jgi:PAS domain S-box-containing protein